jgi:glyoxylate/hydroxypyruvate reductase
VLFVLAPGGEDTRHVVNADFLRKMKKNAVLVNAARGTLVDSDALAQALREEWIWGAGLDVVEGEPHIGADHPLVREPRYVQYNICSSFLFSGLALPLLFSRFVLGKKSITDGHWKTRIFRLFVMQMRDCSPHW